MGSLPLSPILSVCLLSYMKASALPHTEVPSDLPELSSHLLFFQTLEPSTPQKGKDTTKKKKKQFGKKSE